MSWLQMMRCVSHSLRIEEDDSGNDDDDDDYDVMNYDVIDNANDGVHAENVMQQNNRDAADGFVLRRN